MSRSPAAARRRLGREIRDLREASGKLIEDAAARLECSTAKISRLENGKGVPRRVDIEELLRFYRVEDPAIVQRVSELITDSRSGEDWFDNYRDVVKGEAHPDHLQRIFTLERDAAVIKVFEPELIYGPLQSDEYIDAVCATFLPELTLKERARLVQFRGDRGLNLLRKGSSPEISFIVGELAVIRGVGGPGVMRRQLEALITDLRGPLQSIDFRLLPLPARSRGAYGGPFQVLRFDDQREQDVVYLEGRNGATYLESDGDVRRYELLFSGLEHDALSREESLDRLAEQALVWEKAERG